jgi:hypothetical protein
MAIKENLQLVTFLGLGALGSSCSTTESPDFSSEIAARCSSVSEELKVIHPGFSDSVDELTGDFQRNLDLSVSIFRSRYFPDSTNEEMDKFKKDFTLYLRGKQNFYRVCRVVVEPKLLVDFVDAFEMENPNYLGGDEKTHQHPKGSYDVARYATLGIWAVEENGQLLAHTLKYGEAFSKYRSKGGPRPLPNVSSVEKAFLTYDNPANNIHYDFTTASPFCDDPFFRGSCGEPILLGRNLEGSDYTLDGAINGIHEYLKAREECFGAC